MNKEIAKKLEALQELVIDNLIEQLKGGDTSNISTANTLLMNNKIVIKPEESEGMHDKVKRIMKKQESK